MKQKLCNVLPFPNLSQRNQFVKNQKPTICILFTVIYVSDVSTQTMY